MSHIPDSLILSSYLRGVALEELVDPDEAPGHPVHHPEHLGVVEPGLCLPLEQGAPEGPAQEAPHWLNVVGEEDPAEAAPQLQICRGAGALS